jgi:phosphate transport system permease protein
VTLEKHGKLTLVAVDRRLRARRALDRLAVLGMAICTIVTSALLLTILSYVVYRGASAINWDFLTKLPKPQGESGGGIVNALVGSVVIVGVATLMAAPIGIGAAIFLNEFPSRWLGGAVRFVANILTGVPSIVVGLFAYSMVVAPMQGFSGMSGAVAYAFIMVPIILISAQEALRLVPTTLREASLALGVPRWRTILSVVLPASSRALLTGLVLAIARALGETAPLLFTAFGNQFWNVHLGKPMAAMPLVIYRYAIGPYDDWHRQAWGAAFVLVLIVVLASIITRFVFRTRYEE